MHMKMVVPRDRYWWVVVLPRMRLKELFSAPAYSVLVMFGVGLTTAMSKNKVQKQKCEIC